MAGNQAVVQFLIEYAEKGGNLPEKVKRDLDRLSQSSTQASSVTDKLGQAFARLERREPMMAMRALRGAVDDLAVSAIGATGPAGRLISSFATLGGGGVQSLFVLGGIGAALGGLKLAVSAVLNPLLTATEGLDKFTAGLKRAKTATEQLHDLQVQLAAAAPRVGVLYGLAGNAPGFLGGIGAGAGEALDRAYAASRAAADALAASQHATAIGAVQDLEIQTASLYSNAEAIARVTAAQKGWNAADTEAFVLSSVKHANAVQATADLKAQAKALEDVKDGFAIIQRNVRDLVSDPNFQFFVSSIPALNLTPTKTEQGFGGMAGFVKGGIENAPRKDPFGVLQESLKASGEAALKAARAHQIASVQIVNAAFGIFQALASGGGFGGILSGIGGLVGLSNPLLGAVIGGVGGLINSAESNVRVSSLSPTAQEQMAKSLNRTPDRVNVIVVDSTGRRIDEFIYEAGRRTRRDAVQRLPAGG